MKTKLDLATKLHYELNLDNFFNVDITQYKVTLLGWYNLELEVLLFSKGYQLEWNKDYKSYRFESENIVIALTEKIEL
ncbi:hypothetical protein UFOVP598_47 [uncultured Caudovirales phage]|uniref:Uncharacterized protein n=1 Tax=uncultured Caudovirales phage TaxID=2100421 RepID=A0A6J5MZH0_9CAUD|nr:hypothetical protein UFOVP598_47 [uncultured Caudovirales phage]